MKDRPIDSQYEDLLHDVFHNGLRKTDKHGDTKCTIFGAQLRYNLQAGFPLITTRGIDLKPIVAELLWFLTGSENVDWLNSRGFGMWDEWADIDGNVGITPGTLWRSWLGPNEEEIDQMQDLLTAIEAGEDSPALTISSWSPAELDQMPVAPSHAILQFHVVQGRLSCQVYQRSADLVLEVPSSIAMYALLTHMVAQQTGLEVGDFVWTGGDCYIQEDYADLARWILQREPYPFPMLELKKAPSLIGYEIDDVEVVSYRCYGDIPKKHRRTVLNSIPIQVKVT